MVVIIQARSDSTRLPGKVLADIGGHPMLAHVIDRARGIPGVAEAVLATITTPADDALVALARRARIPCIRGSEADVLNRFHLAAAETGAEVIARVTAGCPLLDPGVSGLVVSE